MMPETAETTIKRLRMRAWRRGTKEMDLILGPYADEKLAGMSAEGLAAFDLLLAENDHDLYAWVTGTMEAPEPWRPLVTDISGHARDRLSAEI